MFYVWPAPLGGILGPTNKFVKNNYFWLLLAQKWPHNKKTKTTAIPAVFSQKEPRILNFWNKFLNPHINQIFRCISTYWDINFVSKCRPAHCTGINDDIGTLCLYSHQNIRRHLQRSQARDLSRLGVFWRGRIVNNGGRRLWNPSVDILL